MRVQHILDGQKWEFISMLHLTPDAYKLLRTVAWDGGFYCSSDPQLAYGDMFFNPWNAYERSSPTAKANLFVLDNIDVYLFALRAKLHYPRGTWLRITQFCSAGDKPMPVYGWPEGASL